MLRHVEGVSVDAATEQSLPIIVTRTRARSLDRWAADHGSWIDEALVTYGAILFRGFEVADTDEFARVAPALCGKLASYVYRSTPRTSVGHNVYTATEYRADAVIPMHNENAYQRDWPMRLAFCCVQPALRGGETPLASVKNVTRRIGPGIMREFASPGIMYVRNYGECVDLPWTTVFQTESPEEVERFCRGESIAFEWLPDGGLRTTQVCQAVATHPITGDELWFNQAHLFHSSSSGAETEATMLEIFGEARLPRHAYRGDGERLGDALLQHVRHAYESEALTFGWQRGDVLLVDNMLIAHGRESYEGPRRILVGMGSLYSTHAVPQRVCAAGSVDRRVADGADLADTVGI